MAWKISSVTSLGTLWDYQTYCVHRGPLQRSVTCGRCARGPLETALIDIGTKTSGRRIGAKKRSSPSRTGSSSHRSLLTSHFSFDILYFPKFIEIFLLSFYNSYKFVLQFPRQRPAPVANLEKVQMRACFSNFPSNLTSNTYPNAMRELH